MAAETILQHWVVTNFILPFFLIFFIVFGILEKTKMFGEGRAQLHAFVAFVIGLIFVGAIFPKLVVANLILFLTVALVVVFVALLLWGFVSGEDAKLPGGTPVKIIAGILIVVAVVIAVVYSTGVESTAYDWLFGQSWSSTFWTNFFFIGLIIIALVLVLRSTESK